MEFPVEGLLVCLCKLKVQVRQGQLKHDTFYIGDA